MRAYVSPSRFQRAQQQLQTATAIKATKEAQAIASNVSAIEINIGELNDATNGLDVPNINQRLADLDLRVADLEQP